MGYCNRKGEIDDAEERDENGKSEVLQWMKVRLSEEWGRLILLHWEGSRVWRVGAS